MTSEFIQEKNLLSMVFGFIILSLSNKPGSQE